MGSVYIAERLPLDPLILNITDRAFRVYVSSVCYASQWSLGKVHVNHARMIAGRKGRHYVDELVSAGLAEWVDDSDSYFMPIGEGDLWKRVAPARRHIPDHVRQSVYDRDGFACRECGAENSLSLDHIHPYSLGGSDHIDNLQTLCKPCNSRKGARV